MHEFHDYNDDNDDNDYTQTPKDDPVNHPSHYTDGKIEVIDLKERKMKDKQRLIDFITKLIPDDFVCGHIAVTFNDDDSLFITVNNKEDSEE